MSSTFDADVVVVGAGPAGSACASSLAAQHGIEAVVLDKASFPRPKTCAGGVSSGAIESMRRLGTWPAVEKASQRMDRALLVTQWGTRIVIDDDAAGCVLDRRRLDAIGIERARSLGSDVREGWHVSRVEGDPGSMLVHARDADGRRACLRARWVVVAAGSSWRKGIDGRSGRLINTLMARYRGMEHDRNRIEMHFTESLHPHYGWLFPEPDGICNVGIGVDARDLAGRTVNELLGEFVDMHIGDRARGAERIGRPAGFPIFPSAWPSDPGRPGMLLAGEAARLVNPLTGEGIGPALRSGILAAEAVASAIAGRTTPGDTVRGYLRGLRRDIGPSLLLADGFRMAGVRHLDFIFDNRRWFRGWRTLLHAAAHL